VGLVGFLGFCEREKKEYIGEIGKKIFFFPCLLVFEEEKDP